MKKRRASLLPALKEAFIHETWNPFKQKLDCVVPHPRFVSDNSSLWYRSKTTVEQGSSTAVQTTAATPTPSVETDAELYEKAKQEGKVTVYTASTGVTNQAKATFEKQYPGVQVEVFSLGTQALMDKVVQEQKAGIYNADFILIKENGGAIKHEMVDSGAFVPLSRQISPVIGRAL